MNAISSPKSGKKTGCVDPICNLCLCVCVYSSVSAQRDGAEQPNMINYSPIDCTTPLSATGGVGGCTDECMDG